MSASQSIRSYDDCVDLFDQALAADKGIKIVVYDHGTAMNLKTRMNYCRKLLRLQSMTIYNEGDPEYGVSPYENLSITVKLNNVFIKRHGANLQVHEITEEASP